MDLVSKYRPTSLEDVIGQDAAVAALRGMLRSGNVPPTVLFSGPHSTGKTTLAWILAMSANCVQLDDSGDACGKCPSCVKTIKAIRNGTNTASIIEKPVSDRGIDSIRELQKSTSYKSSHKYWFFIIDEVHNLTKQAFDAALRLFEKPPKQARFILCTTEPHVLPATILSRSTHYRLNAIQPKVTAKELLFPVCKKEKAEVPNKILLQVARSVQGHPRDALNLLSQVIAAGASNFDIKDMSALITSSEVATPYIAIQRYCTSVFEGKYGNALLAASRVGSVEYFVGQVIQTMRLVMQSYIGNKLLDQTKEWMLKEVRVPNIDPIKPEHIEALGQMLDICLDTQARVKTYLCDNAALVDAMTIRLVSAARSL